MFQILPKYTYTNSLCLVVLFLISSCSVQKRHYQKGFYISSVHKAPFSQNANLSNALSFERLQAQVPDSCDLIEFTDGTKIKGQVVEISRQQLVYLYCDGDAQKHKIAKSRVLKVEHPNGKIDWYSGTATTPVEPVVESVPATIPSPSIVETKQDSLSASSPLEKPNTGNLSQVAPETKKCDRVIFQNGTEVFVNVSEVGVKEIRYKMCDMLDGPDFVILKSDIFMIQYKNGDKDVFKREEIQPNESPYLAPKKVNKTLASMSVSFAVSGFLAGFGSIPAVVLAGIYLRRNRLDPETYPARETAILGLVLGIIGIALKLLIVALLFF